MDADVVVIGAGLAGLCAAREAAANGYSVSILEARNRIGGRVATVFERGHTHPIEHGAEWVSNEGMVRELLEAHGASLFHADGNHWVRSAQGVHRVDLDDFAPALDYLKTLGLDREDLSLREALDRSGSGIDAEIRQSLLGYVEGFHAADPDRLSARWLLEVEASQSADASGIRCDDGNRLISESIARSMGLRVSLHLEHVVMRVQWERDRVAVTARHGADETTVHASKVIVTVPLGVLKAKADAIGAIAFDPPLTQVDDPLSKLEVGHAIRMTFVFHRAFWEELDELPDLLFAQKFDERVPTWWRADPRGAPILIGWAAGPQISKLEGIRGDVLRDAALDSLAATLGVSRDIVQAEFVSWHFHDWEVDPFARGSYTYVAVGGLDAWKTLSAPIDDTVFLAGEAVIGEGFNATMEGACRSGVAAGRLV